MRFTRLGRAVMVLMFLGSTGCADGRETPSPSGGGASGPPLPAACEVVTRTDVQSAMGAAVSDDRRGDGPDRCRYTTERRAQVEITLDRPGFTGAVGAYLGLNPDAERVEGIGDEAALRIADGAGELVFVKGSVRFFVLVDGGPPSREALLRLAEAAARRL